MNDVILIDLPPGGSLTPATQESRRAEGPRPPGRSVQRTRGADVMARRTGNPRLARHHNKRNHEVQTAIEAERRYAVDRRLTDSDSSSV
jgi:hypothetical protein